MAKCPGCGGELRFDIKTQELLCDNCGTHIDPYEYDSKEKAADSAAFLPQNEAEYINEKAGKKEQADDTFTVNVFTCPDCGGEIISTSNAAVEFSRYCGSEVTLEGRLSDMKRPELIMPFKKDRDDLRKICAAKMKKAIFAPKEMRDPGAVDSFRGIYIPYWTYNISRNGPAATTAVKVYTKDSYQYTETYQVDFNTEASYEGISFDASSSFEDDIGDAIAPFSSSDMKPFTPSYISGFYADTADVPADTYERDALSFAGDDIIEKLNEEKEVKDVIVNDQNVIFNRDDLKSRSALFPVWFMTYKKRDRIAYAVINGETGKMSADMPIDPLKYVLFSLLIALPVFLIMDSAFMLTAPDTAVFSTILTLAGMVTYVWEMKTVLLKDSHTDDRGYRSSVERDRQGKQTAASDNAADGKDNAAKKKKQGKKKKNRQVTHVDEDHMRYKKRWDFWDYIFALVAAGVVIFVVTLIGRTWTLAAADIIAAVMAWYWLSDANKKFDLLIWVSLAMPLITVIILLADPIYDSVYYTVTIIQAITVFLQMKGLIKEYNMLSTRKLPQFNREGGDNRA